MPAYRSIVWGLSTSWNLNIILGFNYKSVHTGSRKLNLRFWEISEANYWYFIEIPMFSSFLTHANEKSPIFSCQKQLNTVIIRKIKCLSQRRNCSVEIPVHLRTKEKNVDDSSLLKDNVLIIHGFSQLRTTVSQGSKKIIRVWKEASCLVTEIQLQIFSCLHQPMWPWVNHLTFPHSFIFQCLPHAAHSIWNAFFDSSSNSKILKKCCSVKFSLIPLTKSASFLLISPVYMVHTSIIIYHMALLLHIYHFVYFILAYHVILQPSYGIRLYAISSNIYNIISSIMSTFYVSGHIWLHYP